jgi:hypothetical protein
MVLLVSVHMDLLLLLLLTLFACQCAQDIPTVLPDGHKVQCVCSKLTYRAVRGTGCGRLTLPHGMFLHVGRWLLCPASRHAVPQERL